MKSRRSFVVAILLVAIMCIGVGFAALNSTINGTGTITYTPAFDIEWTETVTGSGVSGVAVSTTTHTNDTLAFTVDTSGMAIGNTTTVTATVVNNSKYAANNVTVTPNSETATTDACYTVVAAPSATTIAANGGEITVTFTIELTAYPQVDKAHNVTFNFSVSAVQAIA